MSRIIGIGGISQSGKSSLSSRLREFAPHLRILILEMDKFVYPESNIPKINDQTDWDRPESINFEQIISSISENQNKYDVIIVEGILAFAHEPLKKLYDLSIFLEISKETFLSRRTKETRWGKEEKWYWEHVWKSYLEFGQHPDPDLRISGEVDFSPGILETVIQKAGLGSISAQE